MTSKANGKFVWQKIDSIVQCQFLMLKDEEEMCIIWALIKVMSKDGELGIQFRIMTYKRQRKTCEYRGHYRKENLTLKYFILMKFLKFVIKFEKLCQKENILDFISKFLKEFEVKKILGGKVDG